MALVDLTSVTTGNIGTNTNFIVEENKVLKRISQSSLLKTSAISTTHVNSTTNVPSSSLVYSMNQAINTLNSDFANGISSLSSKISVISKRYTINVGKISPDETIQKTIIFGSEAVDTEYSINVLLTSHFDGWADIAYSAANKTRQGFTLFVYNKGTSITPNEVILDWAIIRTTY